MYLKLSKQSTDPCNDRPTHPDGSDLLYSASGWFLFIFLPNYLKVRHRPQYCPNRVSLCTSTWIVFDHSLLKDVTLYRRRTLACKESLGRLKNAKINITHVNVLRPQTGAYQDFSSMSVRPGSVNVYLPLFFYPSVWVMYTSIGRSFLPTLFQRNEGIEFNLDEFNLFVFSDSTVKKWI